MRTGKIVSRKSFSDGSLRPGTKLWRVGPPHRGYDPEVEKCIVVESTEQGLDIERRKPDGDFFVCRYHADVFQETPEEEENCHVRFYFTEEESASPDPQEEESTIAESEIYCIISLVNGIIFSGNIGEVKDHIKELISDTDLEKLRVVKATDLRKISFDVWF